MQGEVLHFNKMSKPVYEADEMLSSVGDEYKEPKLCLRNKREPHEHELTFVLNVMFIQSDELKAVHILGIL